MVAVVADVSALVRREPLPPLHGGAHRPPRRHHGARIHQRISRYDRRPRSRRWCSRETGASHRSLHNFFGIDKANVGNIERLLAAVKKHSKPVPPAQLGIIGKEHLFAGMEAAGGDPRTFAYTKSLGETGGIPRVIEFAFGTHRDGLAAARVPRPQDITGVNWSPGINNPFR